MARETYEKPEPRSFRSWLARVWLPILLGTGITFPLWSYPWAGELDASGSPWWIVVGYTAVFIAAGILLVMTIKTLRTEWGWESTMTDNLSKLIIFISIETVCFLAILHALNLISFAVPFPITAILALFIVVYIVRDSP